MKLLSLTSLCATVLLGASALAVSGCSAGSDEGTTASGGNGSSSGGSGTQNGSGSGGSLPALGGTTSVGGGGNPDGSCIRVAILGRAPSYGAGGNGTDGSKAFIDWLNTKSTARVDEFGTDTELTAEFLAPYQVIIIQALESAKGGPYWQISAAEIAAVQAWVEAGGGVVTMTGYSDQAGEVDPTNTLLAFTGMSYNKDDIAIECDNTAEAGCCFCYGASVPSGGFVVNTPLAPNMTKVGVFHGRSINAGDATVVMQNGGKVYGAMKDIGAGHVFMFCDEWVTYTSQWGGNALQTMYPACYEQNNSCNTHTVEKNYSVPQFWYNSLLYASGNVSCFDIDDPDIVE